MTRLFVVQRPDAPLGRSPLLLGAGPAHPLPAKFPSSLGGMFPGAETS